MNRFLAILIICMLSCPVIAIEGQDITEPVQSTEQIETLTEQETDIINNTNALPEAVATPSENKMYSGYKEPVSKKKLIKKFIIAMLCVAGASVFLYLALSVYNRLREIFTENVAIPPEGEKPLETPADLTEAVKTFIDKTHWEN